MCSRQQSKRSWILVARCWINTNRNMYPVQVRNLIPRNDSLFFSFCLHFVGLFLSACRWRLLLNAQGIDASLRALSSSYMVGFFFNTFLPTTVGGDITRAYDVSRRGHLMGGKSPTCNRVPQEARTEKSIAVILVERSGGVGICRCWRCSYKSYRKYLS